MVHVEHGSAGRRALVVASLAAALVMGGLASPATAEPPPVPAELTEVAAVDASALGDSFGWNTHWNYYDTVYGDYAGLRPLTQDLGVRQMRDGVPYNDDLMRKYKELCADGVRFTIITGYEVDIPELPGVLRELGRECITAVAGQNEPDLFKPPSGEDWAVVGRARQQELFATINADPELADIPVLSPSPAFDFTRMGSMEGIADRCDIHPYGSYYGLTTGDGYSSIYRTLERARPLCGDLPLTATEVGFHTAIDYDTSVDKHFPTSELGASRMMAKAVVSYWNAGITLHHNYELVDQDDDSRNKEGSFGTIRRDLSPKPSFDVMRRLGALLGDRGTGTFTPGSLTFSLAGDTARVETLLAQRADGTYLLLVQSNDPVWDHEARADVAPPAREVTVTLGRPAAVTVHSLGQDSPLATLDGAQVPLTLGPDLQVLEIGGTPGAPAPSVTPTAAPAPTPTVAPPPPVPTPTSQPTVLPAPPQDEGGTWLSRLKARLARLFDEVWASLSFAQQGPTP